MTKYQRESIAEMLDNVTYWDSCPQGYKDRIPELIEALKQEQSLSLVEELRISKLIERNRIWSKLLTHVVDEREEDILINVDLIYNSIFNQN